MSWVPGSVTVLECGGRHESFGDHKDLGGPTYISFTGHWGGDAENQLPLPTACEPPQEGEGVLNPARVAE